jgi:uncharacterized membrane protein
MFFAGLSLLEALAIFSLAGGLTVALYLLSRSRQRLTVSTLRFWRHAEEVAQPQRRRRIDQPWSLLLQLLALLALVLAIAQPRWGSPAQQGRDHVLLLDTSSWMEASGRQGILAEQVRKTALDWLGAIPAQDRVMVVRAASLAAPATGFEADRRALAAAIRASQPTGGALALEQAFALAVQAQRMQARQAGEIVYVGHARLAAAQLGALQVPPNLRILPVSEPLDNVGLTRVAMRRLPEDPGLWEVFIRIRNHGATVRSAPVVAAMGGAVFGATTLPVPARGEAATRFLLRSTAAGWLEVRLGLRDALAADNRVQLEVPAFRPARVDICTAEPALFRNVFAAESRVDARYLPASPCRPDPEADLAIFDRTAPASEWKRPSFWIEPNRGRAIEGDIRVAQWNAGHALVRGLRAADFKLNRARVLPVEPGETVLASGAQGPLAVVSDADPRRAVFGFHPLASGMRYELATPLFFANLLEWSAPATFRRREVIAGSPGAVAVELARPAEEDPVRVIRDDGQPLPFTVEGRSLRFFLPEPAGVRVQQGGMEQVYSLTLPDLGDTAWEAPPTVRRGMPSAQGSLAAPRDLWRWLAVLGAVLIALEWWLFARKLPAGTRSRRVSLALKAATLTACLLALFAPGLDVPETKLAVGLLVDTSDSVAAAGLAKASELAQSLRAAAGRHQVLVFPFARSIRPLDATEALPQLKLRATAGEAGRTTDIEESVLEAIAALPAGLVPRLVLISDGRETRGSAIRAAHQARLLGVPIDTYVLPGRPQPKLRLLSARLPGVAFTGEKFPIELVLDSPARASGSVELRAEGKLLGSSPVTIEPGENFLRVTAAVSTPGAIAISGTLTAPELGEVRFEQAVQLRRPRLLYLSQDPAGSGTNLLETLSAAHFEVTSASSLPNETLDAFQVVVFNNWDLEAIPPARKAALEKYVQQGGGLLIIGGEKNVYVEKKQPDLDPLERVLPATIAPPRTPEGALVILIVDKSSSMEGRKMELARLAAIGAVENLKPVDYVGVLIFDNSHQWAVPIRRAEDRTLIKRLIAGITPDGGTQIAPALAEAYRRALPAQGVYKHIVLLTDGISEEGDSIQLAQEAANNKVTISTVGLGQDVNRTYLEKVASLAKGKSYFLTDPSGLEQILIKDVLEHTGSTTVERPVQPRVVKQADVLSGLSMESAPPLKGYVRFKHKPGADLLLEIDKEDPLLSRWQYGLGRATVFTSDAKSRWAEAWVSWPGFDRFWVNLVRDLLPQAGGGEARVSHDPASGALLVEYRLARHTAAPPALPPIYVLGPEDFRARVPMEKVAEGHYRGAALIGTRTGLFRIRPLEDSRLFPESGIYLPEPEFSRYGNDPALLRQLAAFTGGRFEPSPSAVFESAGRSVVSRLNLWPGLLALAILLNLLEIAWRRLRASAAGGLQFRPAMARAA